MTEIAATYCQLDETALNVTITTTTTTITITIIIIIIITIIIIIIATTTIYNTMLLLMRGATCFSRRCCAATSRIRC